MNSYLLDTSTIINILRGKKEEENLINNLEGEQTSSYGCLSELYEGIIRSAKREEQEKNIVKFFSRLHNVFGLDNEVAKEFGQIRSDLKKSGNIIEDLDILIAATCIANNQILITSNKKHFARVQNLKIF